MPEVDVTRQILDKAGLNRSRPTKESCFGSVKATRKTRSVWRSIDAPLLLHRSSVDFRFPSGTCSKNSIVNDAISMKQMIAIGRVSGGIQIGNGERATTPKSRLTGVRRDQQATCNSHKVWPSGFARAYRISCRAVRTEKSCDASPRSRGTQACPSTLRNVDGLVSTIHAMVFPVGKRPPVGETPSRPTSRCDTTPRPRRIPSRSASAFRSCIASTTSIAFSNDRSLLVEVQRGVPNAARKSRFLVAYLCGPQRTHFETVRAAKGSRLLIYATRFPSS